MASTKFRIEDRALALDELSAGHAMGPMRGYDVWRFSYCNDHRRPSELPHTHGAKVPPGAGKDYLAATITRGRVEARTNPQLVTVCLRRAGDPFELVGVDRAPTPETPATAAETDSNITGRPPGPWTGMAQHPTRGEWLTGDGSSSVALQKNSRTTVFVALVVCGNLVGNLLLRAGLRREPALSSLSPLPYLQALLSPWVIAGVLLLMLGLASQLALLSWADLSYVAPVTSIGYVLAALAGKVFLGEPLSTARWAAIAFIAGGVLLVTRTPPSAAGRREVARQ